MRQVETERKFDIDEDAPLPALGALVTVGGAREHAMRAVYLDTADLVLIRNRMTLRRREGGADEGWHLKLPATGSSRTEVHAPLGEGPGRMRVPDGHRAAASEALPEGLPAGVTGVLLPAAVLSTVRLEIDLLDDAGERVAVLCDDTVTALPAGRTWRELEVELVGDHGERGEELLDGITRALEAQGVPLSRSASKLGRALGDRPQRAESGIALDGSDRAREVLGAYLAEQVAVILGREADVRADAPDAVHKTRVAARRLRSALRTFRTLLDREVTDPLREEVRWFGEALGAPRDAEVMRERLTAALSALPDHLVVGPVRQRIVGELEARHATAHAALLEALDSDRARALQDALVDLLADTPWRGRADRRARRVLPPLAEQAEDRAAHELALSRQAEGEERMHLLHETRKKAKAARYAWEALAPALGGPAAAAAAAWEEVTEALGGVQDSAVALEWIAELRQAAAAAGEPEFTYGVLAGLEMGSREPAAKAGVKAVERALAHR